EPPLLLLRLPAAPLELEHREHRVVAGMVDEHHGGPVSELPTGAQRQEVADRERFVVRHHQALEAADRWGPAARERCAARAIEENRARIAPMKLRAARPVFLG